MSERMFSFRASARFAATLGQRCNRLGFICDAVIEKPLERAWHEMWMDSGCPKLHDPDAAFLAFCRRRAEKAPLG